MTDPAGHLVPQPAVPAAGELWAYRARGQDPLVQVAVVRLGVKTPQRVLVRFVDEEFEGQQDWVPPARLKVPWSGVDEYVRGNGAGTRCCDPRLASHSPRSWLRVLSSTC